MDKDVISPDAFVSAALSNFTVKLVPPCASGLPLSGVGTSSFEHEAKAHAIIVAYIKFLSFIFFKIKKLINSFI